MFIDFGGVPGWLGVRREQLASPRVATKFVWVAVASKFVRVAVASKFVRVAASGSRSVLLFSIAIE